MSRRCFIGRHLLFAYPNLSINAVQWWLILCSTRRGRRNTMLTPIMHLQMVILKELIRIKIKGSTGQWGMWHETLVLVIASSVMVIAVIVVSFFGAMTSEKLPLLRNLIFWCKVGVFYSRRKICSMSMICPFRNYRLIWKCDICVTVERAEVVLHSSFLWSLRRLVRWRGFRTVQGTVLNRAWVLFHVLE